MIWVKEKLETWQARLLTGLGMLAALAVLLQPDSAWTLDLEKGLLFVGAFVAWLVTTFMGANTAPYPHDVSLYREIDKLLNDDQRLLLSEADFLNSFMGSRTTGVREIRGWNGGRRRFLDKSIAAKWKVLKSDIDAFTDLLISTTAPARGNPQLQTVLQVIEQERGNISEGTRAEAKALNDAATKLTASLDQFEQTAKRRLRV